MFATESAYTLAFHGKTFRFFSVVGKVDGPFLHLKLSVDSLI